MTCCFHTMLGLKHTTKVSILSIPQNIQLTIEQAYCKTTAQTRILSCKPGFTSGHCIARDLMISSSISSCRLSSCFLFASSCSKSSSSCISNIKSCSFIFPQAQCMKVIKVSSCTMDTVWKNTCCAPCVCHLVLAAKSSAESQCPSSHLQRPSKSFQIHGTMVSTPLSRGAGVTKVWPWSRWKSEETYDAQTFTQ